MTKSTKLKLNESGLLDPGIHKPTLHEFREAFVENFPDSETREALYDGYLRFSQKCIDDLFVKKHWIDGSYVTKKDNPEDIDIAMTVDASEVIQHVRNGKSFDHGQVGYIDYLKKEYGCHVFAIMNYPENDSRHNSITKKDEKYWREKWGHTKDQKRKEKGFIQFDVTDVKYCDNVDCEIKRKDKQ